MSQPICLLGAFARHLESRPDALLYRYLLLGNPSGAVAEWTYAETYARCAAVAELVSEHGFTGKRVVLLSQPGLDYVATFLGCLMARVVVVPAYPPVASRTDSTVPRLVAIAGAAQIDGVLTTAGVADEARSLLHGTPLLGVTKPVVIGHGISRERSFNNMLKLAQKMLETDLLSKMKESFVA